MLNGRFKFEFNMAGLSLTAISSLKVNVPKEFGLRDFSAPCLLPLDLPLQTFSFYRSHCKGYEYRSMFIDR